MDVNTSSEPNTSSIQDETNITPNTDTFRPGIGSTPKPNEDVISFNPNFVSTPKKSIRFMDESTSKIHVYPSLPATPNTKKNVKNFATALPVIPDQAQPFNPILYTFRIPGKWPKNLNQVKVRSPPFYVQLDHAIAAIWCMFCPSAKRSLGINQLHWALSFLKSLNNRNHEHPKDVQLCIDAMEDYLIELYADLSVKLEPLKNMDKELQAEEEAPLRTKIPFSLNYSEILPKAQGMIDSGLSGGPLVNYDEDFRKEMEELKEISGTDSVELMTSKSREAAIDYLNETRNKHIRNISVELERVRSLDNLLHVISPDSDVSNMTHSLLRSMLESDESSGLNTTSEDPGNLSSVLNDTSEIGTGAQASN